MLHGMTARHASRALFLGIMPGEGEGDEGSERSGSEKADPAAGADKPVTLKDIKELLDPLSKTVGELNDFRHAEIRRRAKSDDSKTDESDKAEKKTDAQKSDDRRERRLQKLEADLRDRRTGDVLDREIEKVKDQIVEGSASKIKTLLRGGLKEHDGEVVFDTGDRFISVADAVKAEASSSVFKRGAKKKGGDEGEGSGGERREGVPAEVKKFDELDIDNMSDEEFAKLRADVRKGKYRPK